MTNMDALAIGFAFSEGLIASMDDVMEMSRRDNDPESVKSEVEPYAERRKQVGNEKEQDVKQAVLAAAKDENGRKKIPCPEALRIANENGVAPNVVGRICNEEKIKIQNCSLGLF